MTTGTLHAVTIICHTLVLIVIVVAVVVLAIHHEFTSEAIAFLATLGGLTGSGLVINGRNVPRPGARAGDNPPVTSVTGNN